VDETVPRWNVHNDPAVLQVVSNSTPKTYYPVPASRPDPTQASLESVERGLGALNLSTDNPIKSDPSSAIGSFGVNPPLDDFDTLSSDIFSSDFIAAVAQSLDEFDPAIFRPDGDIDFERDFRAWFNQDLPGANIKTPENGTKGKGKEIKEEDEFGLLGTEFSSSTFIPSFASPPSISEQQRLSARNSRSIPSPPGPILRRRDRVSMSAVKSEPSTTFSSKDLTDCGFTPGLYERDWEDIDFERDFGQWFNPDARNSALDREFEALALT